jgi:hypothetical protein
MIRQKIYIKEYDWVVHAYFAVMTYYTDEIMDKLWLLGCEGETMELAQRNLDKGDLNTGLCYSNYRRRESVFVVAKTTSAAQFANSLHHELVHLQSHIAQVYFLQPTGEDVAYLSGELIMRMYPKIKHLLCDCCRKEK